MIVPTWVLVFVRKIGVPRTDCEVLPSAVDYITMCIVFDSLLLRLSKTSRLAFMLQSHSKSVAGRLIHVWVVVVP